MMGLCLSYNKTDRDPFSDLFSRTTWVSQHQKGKTILDFNEARDDGVAVASAGPHHLHLAPVGNHDGISSLIFTGRMLLLDAQPTASKH